MQLGKVKEPQGVGTTGPGLMQEVKEEKFGARRVLIHCACLDTHGDGHDPVQLLLETLPGRRAGRGPAPAALAG